MGLTAQQYAERYLKASDQYAEQGKIEADYLKEFTDTIREKNLLNNSQLVTIIEWLQLKWGKMGQIVSEAYVPGLLPIDPAGFLDLIRSFYPEAYCRYKQFHP